MGIERNNRKPKRRRTTAQRLKGRMKTVFDLPTAAAGQEAAPKAKTPKPKAAAAPKRKTSSSK